MRHVPYMIINDQIMRKRRCPGKSGREATGYRGARGRPRPGNARRRRRGPRLAVAVFRPRIAVRRRAGYVRLLNMFVKPAPHAHTMRIHMAKDADRPWASRAPDAQLGAMSPYARTSSTARS